MSCSNFDVGDDADCDPKNNILHPVDDYGVTGSLPTFEEFCSIEMNNDIIMDVLSQLPEPSGFSKHQYSLYGKLNEFKCNSPLLNGDDVPEGAVMDQSTTLTEFDCTKLGTS